MPADVPEDSELDEPASEELDAPSVIVRVGCSDLPPGLRRSRYFEKLDYLETEGTFRELPKASALRRWREEAGEHGRFGLVAPQVITHRPGPRGYARARGALSAAELAQAGGFRQTDVVRRAVAELASAAAMLGTDAVIFRSPPDFAPSAANRDVLRAFFAEVAPAEAFAGAIRVWEPQGLWEPVIAARFASDNDVVYACDPLSNDPLADGPELYANLPGHLAYFRITGLGQAQQRFDDYAAEALVELVQSYDRAWIVFAHAHKYPDAIRVRRALAT